MKKIILYVLITAIYSQTHASQQRACTQYKQLGLFLGIMATGYCSYALAYTCINKKQRSALPKEHIQKTIRQQCRQALYNLEENTEAILPQVNNQEASYWFTLFLNSTIKKYDNATGAKNNLKNIVNQLPTTTSIPLLLQASNLPVEVMNFVSINKIDTDKTNPYDLTQSLIEANLKNKNDSDKISFLHKAGYLLQRYDTSKSAYCHFWFFTIRHITTILPFFDNNLQPLIDAIKNSENISIDIGDIEKFLSGLNTYNYHAKESYLLALVLFTKTNAWQAVKNTQEKKWDLFSRFQDVILKLLPEYLPYQNDTRDAEYFKEDYPDDYDYTLAKEKFIFEQNFDRILSEFDITTLRGSNFRKTQPSNDDDNESKKQIEPDNFIV